MRKLSLRNLRNTVLGAGRRPGTPARRLAVEQLEDRCVPSTLEAISLPDLNQPVSDTASGASNSPSVSADGRYVAFLSKAPNLVANQKGTAFANNVFLLDRTTGQVTLVSHLPGKPSEASHADGAPYPIFTNPLISRNGRYVVYSTRATDIVGFHQDEPLVVVYDRVADQNTLVSHNATSNTTPSATPPNTDCNLDAISSDGRYVAFDTRAPDVVAGQQSPPDATGFPELFLFDQTTGKSQLVSHAFGQNNLTPEEDPQFRDDLLSASIADDGTVAYQSFATNLVSFTTQPENIYLYNPRTQTNRLITTVAGSPQTDAGSSYRAVISGDASTVVYASAAASLVPNQTGGSGITNVFRYLVAGGTTQLVSGAGGSAAVTGNADSGGKGYGLAVSHDGNVIAFSSNATNLVAGQAGAAGNVFLYDARGPSLRLLSGANGSTQVGAGGVPDLQFHGFPDGLQDLITGRGSQILSLSDDGRLVAYVSHAGNLVANQSGPAGVDNVFLYSAASGTTVLVSGHQRSASATGDFLSSFPALSGDGSVLAFHSLADDLLAGVFDLNSSADVFTYTPANPGTTLVTGAAFVFLKHGGDSFSTGLSGDGRYTVFTSGATNLIANQTTLNNNQNIFLYDKVLKKTVLVNHVPGFANTTGNGGVSLYPFNPIRDRLPAFLQPVVSADGSFVAFASYDTNLVTGEHFPDGSNLARALCIYLYETATGTVRLVNPVEGQPTTINLESYNPVLSADGRYVAYTINRPSGPTDFSTGPLALYDRVADTTTNITPASYLANGGSASDPTISDDGRFVAYADQGNVYLFDRTNAGGGNTLVSHAAGSLTTPANGTSSSPILSHDGSAVAFVSLATNLVANQTGAAVTKVFLYKVGTASVRLVSGAGGSATAGGDGNSDTPAVNGNGQYVAYRSDATNLVAGQVTGSNVYEFDSVAGTQTLVSHQAGAPTTAAGGVLAEPLAIDDDGHLVSYVSTAGNLIPGQSSSAPAGSGPVENVYLWLRQTNANILASGQNGSPTVTGDANSDSPLLTRHSFPSFSSQATNLAGVAGASFVYINTLVQLGLSPNTIANGSPAGTTVGTLVVTSLLVGQYLPPVYSLPAGEANNASFSLGGGTLATGFVANYAGQSGYMVSVHVDIGLGDNSGLLSVFVAAPPPAPVTVTISKAANQPDPSGGPALHFTVVFSAPVADFTAADVTLGGLPGLTATVSGSGTTYAVAVTGMGPAGLVTAAIAAGVAHDGNGTANQAAPTVAAITYDPTAPPALLYSVAQAFARSREHYLDFLGKAYRQYLKREPDPVGLNFWVGSMQAGVYTDEQVEAFFIGSDEYINVRYHGDLSAWVQGMYQDLLLRPASAAEVALWLQTLAAGTPENAVALGFAASPERERLRVVDNYRTFLGRDPSQGEIDLWVNGFLGGLRNEDLVAGFVGSPEYYQSPQKGQDDEATWVRRAYLDVLARAASDSEVALWLQFLG
jgi:Tol biopolymer transport system component